MMSGRLVEEQGETRRSNLVLLLWLSLGSACEDLMLNHDRYHDYSVTAGSGCSNVDPCRFAGEGKDVPKTCRKREKCGHA